MIIFQIVIIAIIGAAIIQGLAVLLLHIKEKRGN